MVSTEHMLVTYDTHNSTEAVGSLYFFTLDVILMLCVPCIILQCVDNQWDTLFL